MTRTILAAAAIFGLVLSPAFAQETPKVKGTVERSTKAPRRSRWTTPPFPISTWAR